MKKKKTMTAQRANRMFCVLVRQLRNPLDLPQKWLRTFPAAIFNLNCIPFKISPAFCVQCHLHCVRPHFVDECIINFSYNISLSFWRLHWTQAQFISFRFVLHSSFVLFYSFASNASNLKWNFAFVIDFPIAFCLLEWFAIYTKKEEKKHCCAEGFSWKWNVKSIEWRCTLCYRCKDNWIESWFHRNFNCIFFVHRFYSEIWFWCFFLSSKIHQLWCWMSRRRKKEHENPMCFDTILLHPLWNGQFPNATRIAYRVSHGKLLHLWIVCWNVREYILKCVEIECQKWFESRNKRKKKRENGKESTDCLSTLV